ncbi:MAG: hypothetical protein AAB250_02735, partial [Bdellovibrionota bacterium]
NQLFGAKTGKLEGPESRNERKSEPGRESEGKRSATRENTDPGPTADQRAAKKSGERKLASAKKDSPKSEA